MCYRSTFFVLSQHPFLSFSCYRSTLASVLSQHFSRICAITALLPPCYRSTLTESVLSQHFNESVLSQHFNESVLSQHFYFASVLSQHLPFLCCRILCYRSTLLCCLTSSTATPTSFLQGPDKKAVFEVSRFRDLGFRVPLGFLWIL